MDGQRVHADVRGAAVDRGGPGRPVRAPAAAGDRHRDLHGGVRRGRAGPIDPRARCRAGGPGSGRRDRHAVDADRPVCRRCPPSGAAWRWASGAASAVWPSRSGRWSAARSSAASPGTGSSGSTSRSGCCSCRSSCCGSTRRAAPCPGSICSDWPWPAPASSGSCGVWSAPTRSAGPPPQIIGAFVVGAALLVSLRRVGAAHRAPDAPDALLRATGRSRWPTSPACSCSSGCSARSSSSRSSSRPCRASRRFSRGCGSCPGRRCRCSSRRSPARSQTASAAIG